MQDWLPSNLGYVGNVLRPLQLMGYAPPAPSTPPWPFESSVQIEDVSEEGGEEEGLGEEDRLEIQAQLDRRKRRRES